MKSRLLLLAALSLTLCACMHNRTDDYVNAQNNPSLKTPPGVNNATFVDHNPIPQKSTSEVVAAPSLVPPGLTEDEATAKVELAAEKAKEKAQKSEPKQTTESTVTTD